MKTFEQLYKERRRWLNSEHIQDWSYLDTKWVAEQYAKAIDRCAEKASLIRPKDAPDRIDKQSILNVKSELK